MHPAGESLSEEAARLRRCLNDLVSVMTLPSLWGGGEPEQIVSTLAEALRGTLELAFVLIRLNDASGGPSTDVVRVAETLASAFPFQEAGGRLDAAFEAYRSGLSRARIRISDIDFNVASLGLGIDGEIGIVVTGSERTDFPEQTERLLLDVAANQAALGLQQARLLSEQKRVARELDERVAQRTRELAEANEHLKRSEHDSRLIVDSIPGLVALMSPTGGLDMINRQLLEYFGQTLEQLREWGTNDTVHPEDLPQVLDVFSKSIADGSPYEILQRFKRADGVYRWFQNRGLPLHDTDGNIVRWCVLLTDIDDQKRAEENLRQSEARKAAILDSALDCIVTIDHQGCITEFNPAAVRTFGHRRDDVVGKPLGDVIIPAALREQHRQGFARHLATGEARVLGRRVEMAAARADGSEFPVELAISRIPLDGPPSFTGYLRDITERKQAEEDLRRSEAFLAEGQSLARMGSFSWWVESGEIIWSAQLYRIFELERGERPTLERIAERVHPDDAHTLADMVDRARKGVSHLEYEHRLLMPDRSVKYVQLVAHGDRNRDGRLEYVGAVQDVTQRRLSEEALNKARAELAHVSRVTALSGLTASIAHEINQPLAGIITNASTCLRMLDANPPNLDGARETARRTLRDGNRASDVITRLRSLFGKKEFARELMDLNQATREIIALMSNDLQRNRVTVQSELIQDLPLVNGDRIQLQQVILNLIRNAAEAMEEVHNHSRILLIRTELESDGYVRLSVKDSGVGLESQGMEKIFDSFYTTKSGGMGIGLAVSRSIIDRHQGRLWAQANEGPGATFGFTIPFAAESVPGKSA